MAYSEHYFEKKSAKNHQNSDKSLADQDENASFKMGGVENVQNSSNNSDFSQRNSLLSSGYLSVTSMTGMIEPLYNQVTDMPHGQHDNQKPLYEYECNIKVENQCIRIISTDFDLVETSASILSDFYAVNQKNGMDEDDVDGQWGDRLQEYGPNQMVSPVPSTQVFHTIMRQHGDNEAIVITDSDDDNPAPVVRSRRTHFTVSEEKLNRAFSRTSVNERKPRIQYSRDQLMWAKKLPASNFMPVDWTKIAMTFPALIR